MTRLHRAYYPVVDPYELELFEFALTRTLVLGRSQRRSRRFESAHLHVMWVRANRCPTGPGQQWPGPLYVRDSEIRLRLLVVADIDTVDELVDDLLDDVGTAVVHRSSEVLARDA